MAEKKYLPNSKWCFVCGTENEAGLRARFFVEDEVVKTPLRIADHHCGYPNVLHGGVVAAALDECMAWAATRALKRMCVTGELTVRYLREVPLNGDLLVCAETVRVHRRLAHTKGVIVDDAGTEYARAEGKFVPLSIDETLKIDDALTYLGGEERVFDGLRRDGAK